VDPKGWVLKRQNLMGVKGAMMISYWWELEDETQNVGP